MLNYTLYLDTLFLNSLQTQTPGNKPTHWPQVERPDITRMVYVGTDRLALAVRQPYIVCTPTLCCVLIIKCTYYGIDAWDILIN